MIDVSRTRRFGLFSAFLLISTPLASQEPPRPAVDLDSILAWDHPGTDIEGKSEVIVENAISGERLDFKSGTKR